MIVRSSPSFDTVSAAASLTERFLRASVKVLRPKLDQGSVIGLLLTPLIFEGLGEK
jgi:hypothetical protein